MGYAAVTMDTDDGFSPQQQRVLARWADDYLAGRRVLCGLFRLLVAIGAVAGAVAAMIAALKSIPSGAFHPASWFIGP